MALVSLALCAVGWLAGELAVLALLSLPIAPFVLMLHARVARDPFNVWKTPLEDV
jgi:hypothetical protein